MDDRDISAFLNVFAPDGAIEVFRPEDTDTPRRRIQGRNDLGDVIRRISRYDKTFHLLGQMTFVDRGDIATGEVYCIAHHLTRASEEDTDRIMHIRYSDVYQRRSGRWVIRRRQLHNQWTAVQTAICPGGMD